MDELLSSLLFVTGYGFLEGYEQSIMKLFVFHHRVFEKSNLVLKVALFQQPFVVVAHELVFLRIFEQEFFNSFRVVFVGLLEQLKLLALFLIL